MFLFIFYLQLSMCRNKECYILCLFKYNQVLQCKLQIYTRMQVTPKIITLRYIIRMQMTPKIITIRYIKRYKTLATLKFSTAAYRVVVSTDHIRLNTWPSNYLFTPKYRLKMMHLDAIISKSSSLMQGVSANNHRRFDLP